MAGENVSPMIPRSPEGAAALEQLPGLMREEAARFNGSARDLLPNRAGAAVAHEKQRVRDAYLHCATMIEAALTRARAGSPSPLADRMREALQRIVDWSDCQCEHDENCCGLLADTDYHCPGCIAALALRESAAASPETECRCVCHVGPRGDQRNCEHCTPIAHEVEIKCRHCGEDIRLIDGAWLDRETHSTCEIPGEVETTKHAPLEQGEDMPLVTAITAVVREADRAFQRVGGSSRHWVRDCFLPSLNNAGFAVRASVVASPEAPHSEAAALRGRPGEPSPLTELIGELKTIDRDLGIALERGGQRFATVDMRTLLKLLIKKYEVKHGV